MMNPKVGAVLQRAARVPIVSRILLKPAKAPRAFSGVKEKCRSENLSEVIRLIGNGFDRDADAGLSRRATIGEQRIGFSAYLGHPKHWGDGHLTRVAPIPVGEAERAVS